MEAVLTKCNILKRKMRCMCVCVCVWGGGRAESSSLKRDNVGKEESGPEM